MNLIIEKKLEHFLHVKSGKKNIWKAISSACIDAL